MGLRRRPHREGDELAAWLEEGYQAAFRTAFLILHNRADAEEAVQEAFLRAWRFRAAVPAGEGVQPWLYRVVVNACLSRMRYDRARPRSAGADRDLDDLLGEDSAAGSRPEASAIASETREAMLQALRRLPEHLRVVVVLRYYAGLSEREIASVVHRRVGTVKSRVHDAKARLARDPALVPYQPEAELLEEARP